MDRIRTECGSWFDADKATEFSADTWWNGSNRIDVNTNSQFEHQTLYLTIGKRWILSCWSDYQNLRSTHEVIEESKALAWLARNDVDPTDDRLPEFASKSLSAELESTEL